MQGHSTVRIKNCLDSESPAPQAQLGIKSKSTPGGFTSSLSSGSSSSSDGEYSPAAVRAERLRLQDVAAAILSYDNELLPAARVCICNKYRIDQDSSVGLLYSPEQQAAHFANVQRCSSVWSCPVCAAKISERRREELAIAVAEWLAAGRSCLMLTYTFSHASADNLQDILELFLRAYSRLTAGRPYASVKSSFGFEGSIKALEVTWGAATGWHPHAHVLVFSSDLLPLVDEDVKKLEDSLHAELLPLWQNRLKAVGLHCNDHGLKVQATKGAIADYIAKFGEDRYKKRANPRVWGTEDELTKAHIKSGRSHDDTTRYSPFDLLRWFADSLDPLPAARFREFSEYFHGKRQLVWSPGFRKELAKLSEDSFFHQKAKTDDDHANADDAEDTVTLANISEHVWLAILRQNARAQLLQVASTGDKRKVQRFLDVMELSVDQDVRSAVAARHHRLNFGNSSYVDYFGGFSPPRKQTKLEREEERRRAARLVNYRARRVMSLLLASGASGALILALLMLPRCTPGPAARALGFRLAAAGSLPFLALVDPRFSALLKRLSVATDWSADHVVD